MTKNPEDKSSVPGSLEIKGFFVSELHKLSELGIEVAKSAEDEFLVPMHLKIVISIFYLEITYNVNYIHLN